MELGHIQCCSELTPSWFCVRLLLVGFRGPFVVLGIELWLDACKVSALPMVLSPSFSTVAMGFLCIKWMFVRSSGVLSLACVIQKCTILLCNMLILLNAFIEYKSMSSQKCLTLI